MANNVASWNGAEPLEDFLDGAPCGLISSASDGTILSVNQIFLAWTRYERSELTGVRHFDDLLTLPCRIYHETHYAPLLQIQGFVQEVALDIRCRDGSILPALVNAIAKRHSDGSTALLRFAVFAARDRRAYERELLLERRRCEEAVKAKADFLAMFAHEIRNPLAAVVLEAELLDLHGARPRGDPAVVDLRRSVDRVLKLINNMLDISKLEAGKLALQLSSFEIGDVVQAVVHTLQPLATARSLDLNVHVDTTLPHRVNGDPMKLDQALTNLVGNAIKFTESGSVTIGVERMEQRTDAVRARFWVADTGIGIPRHRHACIFEEYEQADDSVSRRFGGTGLGLAITRKLIELQGGNVQVASEPERGSTFSFELVFGL